MFYGNKSIQELDSYYQINTDNKPYPMWKHKDCEKIQQAFINHAIRLTLAECRELYETWSDENYCAGWECSIENWSLDTTFDILLPFLKVFMEDKVKRLTTISNQLKLGKYI